VGNSGTLDALTADFILGTVLVFNSGCSPFATGLASFGAALGGSVVVVDMFEVGSTRSTELCWIALQLCAEVCRLPVDDQTVRQLVETSPVHRRRQVIEDTVSIRAEQRRSGMFGLMDKVVYPGSDRDRRGCRKLTRGVLLQAGGSSAQTTVLVQ